MERKRILNPLLVLIIIFIAAANLFDVLMDFLRTGEVNHWELVAGGIGLIGTTILVVYLRVTQKKTARFQAENEEQFQRLFEDSPVGMVLVGMDRRIRRVNRAFCEFVGYTEQELIAQPISVLSPLEDRGQVDSEIRRILEKKVRTVQFQKRYNRKQGEVVWAQVSVTTVAMGQGESVLFGMVVNITERKKAELALISMNEVLEERVKVRSRELSERAEMLAKSETSLRSQTQFLQLILDSIADGVAMADPNGNLILFNRAAEQIYGYNLKESGTNAWWEDCGMFRADRVTRVTKEELPLLRAVRGEVVNEVELFVANYKRPEGFYLASSARPVWDEEGYLRGAVSVFRDITKAKLAEEQMRRTNERLLTQATELSRSNQDLEQFAYVASHDLKEPLRMVSSYVQLLQRRYQAKLDREADEFIQYAVDGVRRMHHLIDDLLAYSHVNRRVEQFCWTDCNRVLGAVEQDLRAMIQESGAEVTHDELPQLYADGMQMHQLFLNLVGNALKYRTERPPRIHVSAESDGKGWTISVRDNGIGIRTEYRDRIFNLFQRLHTREEYPGTGIGLAICKKIVERHGGKIWVNSTLGEGSTFCVWLPQPEVADRPGDRAPEKSNVSPLFRPDRERSSSTH